jgi:hypothetical protein
MEHSMATPAKTKTHKSKLSDLALLILRTAAERKDRLVFPLPESIDAPASKVEKTVKDLVSRGLIEECPAKLEDVIWRTDEQQRHLTLRITAAGNEAVGPLADSTAPVTPASEPTEAPAKIRRSKATITKAQVASKPSKSLPSRHKQATKAERILALLRRPQGASIDELTKSTGWQAHSIRGFLSGTLKTRMKLKLKSDRPESKERRYKVA